MTELVRTATLSRQNSSTELQPSYPVFGRTDSTDLENQPRDAIKLADKIPSDFRPSDLLDAVFGVLALGRTDKEVAR